MQVPGRSPHQPPSPCHHRCCRHDFGGKLDADCFYECTVALCMHKREVAVIRFRTFLLHHGAPLAFSPTFVLSQQSRRIFSKSSHEQTHGDMRKKWRKSCFCQTEETAVEGADHYDIFGAPGLNSFASRLSYNVLDLQFESDQGALRSTVLKGDR